ncbi:usg protein (plasmid) [Shinella yambaruensis]|uniref:usg protein n=1 Tax=Shinella yambaruensis TaxID=415996 RepID=UPI003D7AB453
MRFPSDLERQLNGYGLTTAHILYRIPDFESVLQTYVWQNYDLAPDFPEMHRFLDFWQSKLDGPLHSVRYTHRLLIGPNEWRRVDGEFKLH